MNNLTRRAFLTTSSAVFALVAAIGAIPAAATVLRQPSQPKALNPAAMPSQPLVAHVRDLNTGEILLLVGTREVVYKDVELARRLYTAAQRSL